MKRFFYGFFILTILTVGICGWLVYGSATAFEEKSMLLLVDEQHTDKRELINLLKEKKVISNSFAFEQLGNQFNMWERVNPVSSKLLKGRTC